MTGAHLHHVGSRGDRAGQFLSSRAAWPGWGHRIIEAGRNGRECKTASEHFGPLGLLLQGRPGLLPCRLGRNEERDSGAATGGRFSLAEMRDLLRGCGERGVGSPVGGKDKSCEVVTSVFGPGRYGAIYNFSRDYCRPAVSGRRWCDIGNPPGTESDSMGEDFALGNM